MKSVQVHRKIRFAIGVLAITPLLSLAGARFLASLVAWIGLGRRLPPGMHTYLPAIDLVDVGLVAAGSVISAAVGLALLAPFWRTLAGWSSGSGWRTIWRAVFSLVAAQLALYLLQLALVSQLGGVPDTLAAIGMAFAAHALLVASATISAAVAPMAVPRIERPRLPRQQGRVVLILATAPVAAARSLTALQPRRRAPPLSLSF